KDDRDGRSRLDGAPPSGEGVGEARQGVVGADEQLDRFARDRGGGAERLAAVVDGDGADVGPGQPVGGGVEGGPGDDGLAGRELVVAAEPAEREVAALEVEPGVA